MAYNPANNLIVLAVITNSKIAAASSYEEAKKIYDNSQKIFVIPPQESNYHKKDKEINTTTG